MSTTGTCAEDNMRPLVLSFHECGTHTLSLDATHLAPLSYLNSTHSPLETRPEYVAQAGLEWEILLSQDKKRK